MLVPGANALSYDTQAEQCTGTNAYWFERTAYRKIPYSSCEGGDRPDRGKQHACPGLVGGRRLGAVFWGSIFILPFGLAGLAGWWWYNKAGRPGSIRLGEHRAFGGGDDRSGPLAVIASVPYFLLGVTQAGWAWVTQRVPFLDGLFVRSEPYRQVPIDDDGESRWNTPRPND